MTRGLTLEEQERRAYASGDPSAPLLALALDGDEELAADLQMMEERCDAAERERDDAQNLLAQAVELMSDEFDPDAAQEWLDANRDSLP